MPESASIQALCLENKVLVQSVTYMDKNTRLQIILVRIEEYPEAESNSRTEIFFSSIMESKLDTVFCFVRIKIDIC